MKTETKLRLIELFDEAETEYPESSTPMLLEMAAHRMNTERRVTYFDHGHVADALFYEQQQKIKTGSGGRQATARADQRG